jgi:hypothetical protein
LQNARVLVSFLIRAVVVGLAAAFLVVWWKPTLLAARTRPPRARAERRSRSPAPSCHAEFCRLGGAGGPGGRQHLYRTRRHRAQQRRSDQLFGDYFGRAYRNASSAAWEAA